MWPWPKNFKIPPLYLLFPQNQFSESMAPRLKRERGCGRRNLAKSFIAFCLVLSQFLFSIAFFQTKMVHRVFFLHSGFAGMWKILECFAFLYFSHVLHKLPFYRGITSNISGICGTEGASIKWKIM